MEKKSEDIIKKVSKLIEEGKRRKITDFDSGLLQESFEPIIGTAQEKYEKWCKRLLNLATRLENLRIKNKGSIDDENYSVLKEIDVILSQKPPEIVVIGGEGGSVDIVCRDNLLDSCFCTPDTFDKTMELVKEKEYFELINGIKKLEYKTRARLDDTIFSWHKDDAIKDLSSPKKQEAKK